MPYRLTVRFDSNQLAQRDFEDRKDALDKWEELLWRQDVTQVRVYEKLRKWKWGLGEADHFVLKCWMNIVKGKANAT
jgi:hypothetical protein